MDGEGESILDAVNSQEDGPIPKMPKDFKMPTQEELIKLISEFDMSDEEKNDLKKNILSGQFLKGLGLDQKSQQQYLDSSKIIIFLSCITIMILVFVFFGYKLYRSQTEKERKREEKKKQKQQKKKHK
ncbi:uncharacterized protein [Onthophagus taurus]|uniref:uncharacterized protein n=1 Tax=Onthophagus taurus TaxID=166361 RepID=UPI000C20E973|nr:uncharacterized protein LOC111419650 [Onthophagus taurus]